MSHAADIWEFTVGSDGHGYIEGWSVTFGWFCVEADEATLRTQLDELGFDQQQIDAARKEAPCP